MENFFIHPLTEKDKDWVKEFIKQQWDSPKIISKGIVHHPKDLSGFSAKKNSKNVGLITYILNNNECEIISLNSLIGNIGIGTALINAVKKVAKSFNCKRLWLTTTNDNLKALGFYQKKGFQIITVYPNAVEKARKIKPEIPLKAENGIPIRDEIELEILL